jgi:hypothetical protein
MLSRFQSAIKTVVKPIQSAWEVVAKPVQVVLGIAATPLRLAATAGSVLFGTKNFIDYIGHQHLRPEHQKLAFSYQLASVILAVTTISLTRIPALFRSSPAQKKVPQETSENSSDEILEQALEEIVIDYQAQQEQALHLKNPRLEIILEDALQEFEGQDLAEDLEENLQQASSLNPNKNSEQASRPASNRNLEKASEQVSGQASPQASVSCGRASFALTLQILLRLSVAINGMGVALGAYNSGRSLCNFVVEHGNLHANEENKEKEYYILLFSTFCIALSNVLTYIAYVSSAANKNIDTFTDSIKNKTPLGISPWAFVFASVCASFNVVTSTTFNLLSALSGIHTIEKDIINFPLKNAMNTTIFNSFKVENGQAMSFAGMTALAVIPTEGLTTIFQLAKDFDAMFKQSSQEENNQAKNNQAENYKNKSKCQTRLSSCVSFFKPAAYAIVGIDSLNSAAQGFVSIALVANRFLGWNRYGYILDFALLCALSKMLTQFSFYGKKGIDDCFDDVNNCFRLFNKQKNTGNLDEKSGKYKLVDDFEVLNSTNLGVGGDDIELKEMDYVIENDEDQSIKDFEILDIDNLEVVNDIELKEMDCFIVDNDKDQDVDGYYRPLNINIR